jgi:hypothetical protein
MVRTPCALATATLWLATIAPGAAQPLPDHLKCYKVEDTQPKASYTADLGGLVAEPGCVIKVPGKMLCVEATKTNVTPTPPGGTANMGSAGRFLCYKVKCPKVGVAALQWQDQFGARTVTPSAPKMVCAPEIRTTTTTTTSTTTTTVCTPTTCAAQGKNCGTIPDGCGNMLGCGTCTGFETCGGGGTPNVCGCTPDPDPCSTAGQICGFAQNGCGTSVSCGVCPGRCCFDSCVCSICQCP